MDVENKEGQKRNYGKTGCFIAIAILIIIIILIWTGMINYPEF